MVRNSGRERPLNTWPHVTDEYVVLFFEAFSLSHFSFHVTSYILGAHYKNENEKKNKSGE
jgi:hypothetical protein